MNEANHPLDETIRRPLWRRIFPKPINFDELLKNQVQYLLEATRDVVAWGQTGDDEYRVKVLEIESLADVARRELSVAAGQAFITPIDREDLDDLSRGLDDVVDGLRDVVRDAHALEVAPDDAIRQLCRTLSEGVKNLSEAVELLKNATVAQEKAQQAKHSAHEFENAYVQAMKALFQREDVREIIKVREVYRHLGNCAVQVADTAEILTHALIKIA